MTTMYLIKTNKPNLFQRIDEEAITLYGLTPCVKKFQYTLTYVSD